MARNNQFLVCLIGGLALITAGFSFAALTTDELIQLKTSGIAEDVIRQMVESGYSDVGRVIKLKAAGFKDETLLSIINHDLKTGGALPAAQLKKPVSSTDRTVEVQTTAKVRIERYLTYGDPILQNSQDIANATIQLTKDKRLQFVWAADKGQSALDEIFQSQTFASPFYWDINKGDKLDVAAKSDNTFILRSDSTHQGRPTTDDSHYWIVYITPGGADLVKRIKELQIK